MIVFCFILMAVVFYINFLKRSRFVKLLPPFNDSLVLSVKHILITALPTVQWYAWYFKNCLVWYEGLHLYL